MPTPIPIPGEIEVEYTTKKVTIKGPATFVVRDPRTNVEIERIEVQEGGEYDGKVANVRAKGGLSASRAMRDLNTAAIGRTTAPPTIEVAMELPSNIIDSPATRMVLSVSDRLTNVDLPVTAYGSGASFKGVRGESAAVTALSESRPGHGWAGFRISGIDYARLARYYDPTDLVFTISAEQINGRHKDFGRQSRIGIVLLDGKNSAPVLHFISELTFAQWSRIKRDRPRFPTSTPKDHGLSREQIIELYESIMENDDC